MSEASEPQYVEIEADSVEEAIQQGLEELGLTRAEVTVEVLDEGGRGVLGLGGRAARVRLTVGDVPYQELADEPVEPVEPPMPEPEVETPARAPSAPPARPTATDDEDVTVAQAVLRELLDRLQINAETQVRRAQPSGDESEAPWVIDVQGEDLGVLIGRRGETLNALQYITRLIASRERQQRVNVVIDVEGYKTRREETLRKLAHRMAEEARQRGRTVKLEPMPPNERRIIHIALRDDPSVETESEGVGDKRKVTIRPVHIDESR